MFICIFFIVLKHKFEWRKKKKRELKWFLSFWAIPRKWFIIFPFLSFFLLLFVVDYLTLQQVWKKYEIIISFYILFGKIFVYLFIILLKIYRIFFFIKIIFMFSLTNKQTKKRNKKLIKKIFLNKFKTFNSLKLNN